MRIKQATIFTLIILVSLVSLKPASAEEQKAEAVKPVEESVNELLNVRDDTTLTEEEKLAKELEARKKILSEVITLSLEEISKLSAKVETLPKFEEESSEKALQDKFKELMTEYSAYYNNQAKQLGELNNIDDVKKLAQEIKDYRETNYNPQVQKVVSFVLIFYNEEVLKTAKTRLDKISADITKLENLGYLKTGAFAEKIKAAADTINKASELNKEAKTLMLTPPEEKEESEIQTMEAGATEEVSPPPPAPTLSELTQGSLNKVKEAYGMFLQIGKDLRKILGLE